MPGSSRRRNGRARMSTYAERCAAATTCCSAWPMRGTSPSRSQRRRPRSRSRRADSRRRSRWRRTSSRKCGSTWSGSTGPNTSTRTACPSIRRSTSTCRWPPTRRSTPDCARWTSGAGSGNRGATCSRRGVRSNSTATIGGIDRWRRGRSCPRWCRRPSAGGGRFACASGATRRNSAGRRSRGPAAAPRRTSWRRAISSTCASRRSTRAQARCRWLLSRRRSRTARCWPSTTGRARYVRWSAASASRAASSTAPRRPTARWVPGSSHSSTRPRSTGA